MYVKKNTVYHGGIYIMKYLSNITEKVSVVPEFENELRLGYARKYVAVRINNRSKSKKFIKVQV